jgi:hypothetical protein
LLEWVNGAVGAGFVGEGSKGILREGRTGEECVEILRNYKGARGRFKLEWGSE